MHSRSFNSFFISSPILSNLTPVISSFFPSHHFHPDSLLARPEAQHLVHLQTAQNVVGDEEHGDLALQGVDGFGEACPAARAVQRASGFVEMARMVCWNGSRVVSIPVALPVGIPFGAPRPDCWALIHGLALQGMSARIP